MLAEGLHTYEFLNEQLVKVKALKHLVKQHDLRVKDCINHSDPKILDIFKDLDYLSDVKQINQIEEETKSIIENLEANVDKACEEVEVHRAELEAESRNVINTVNSRLQQIVKALYSLHNLTSEMDKIIQIQQQQEMERSKEAFSTDDTFKALLDQKHALANEEASLRAQIKELDNTEINELENLSKTLKTEKLQLEQELQSINSGHHEFLAQSQHLDDVAAEVLEEFMSSTAPLGDWILFKYILLGSDLKSVQKPDIASQNASQDSNLWNVMLKEPHQLLTDLFQADVKTLFKDYDFTETELSLIQAIIEQRKRERKIISDIATHLAEFNEVQEPQELHPFIRKVLITTQLDYSIGDRKADINDFDIYLMKPPKLIEIPMEDDEPANKKTVSPISQGNPAEIVKPFSKRLPPHLNLLQDF